MKKKKRKLSGFGVFLLVVFFSVVVFIVLSFTVLFPIKNITVLGNSSYSTEQIINASGISEGNNMLLISEKGISKKVSKQLPYVESVKIKRDLQGNISLEVFPETKKYFCKFNNSYIIISEQLKVLENKTKLTSKEKKLAKILGIDSCSVKTGELYEIYDETKNDLFKSINEYSKKYGIKYSVVDLNSIADITVQIEDRVVVELGSSSELSGKFAHLNEMINKIDKAEKGIIDLKSWSNEKPEGYFRKKSIKNYFK